MCGAIFVNFDICHMAKIVFHDIDLLFKGKLFLNVNISDMMRASAIINLTF